MFTAAISVALPIYLGTESQSGWNYTRAASVVLTVALRKLFSSANVLRVHFVKRRSRTAKR